MTTQIGKKRDKKERIKGGGGKELEEEHRLAISNDLLFLFFQKVAFSHAVFLLFFILFYYVK
jgi:hypothetical protein